MTLALVISSLSSGGAERVMCLLANQWAERGRRIWLITLDSTATDCYSLDGRVRRVALGLMAESPGFWTAILHNYYRIVALRRALIAAGSTAVLSFGEQTNVLVVLATRFTRLRVVISERTDPGKHRIGKIWEMLRRLTYPLAEALIVQTRALVPWAQSVVGKRRAYVIPNPVRDMERFAKAQRVPSSAVIVAAGRLTAVKGFDVLVKAFAEIAREFPEWRLVIVGDGPERIPLKALAKKLGIDDQVSLTGWISEPGEALAAATLFVLSSHYEGFPNALVEAMACGLPVISTACRGPLEIVTDEIDGLLVPTDSVSELANAMRRLLKDESLRNFLGRNARAVVTRYSMEAIVAKWDAVLTDQPPVGSIVPGSQRAAPR